MIAGSPQPATGVGALDAETVLATRGRSFYWARHLLGARHAARATRLYRFCRYVDDLADDASSVEEAAQALAALGDAIKCQHAVSPLVADMLELMRECGIDAAVVLELIDGVRTDLGSVRFADENALLRYCYQVAGTVGVMMCGVLDVADQAAFYHAIDLGIAMQLTNICRDVAEDAALGRRYLPASLVGHCEPSVLEEPDRRLRPVVDATIAALLARAETYYRSGEAGLPYLPAGARAAILVAARLYRAIGRCVRRRRPDADLRRITVAPTAKIALTLQALCQLGLLPRGLPRHRPLSSGIDRCRHDALLHVPLAGLPLTVFADGKIHDG